MFLINSTLNLSNLIISPASTLCNLTSDSKLCSSNFVFTIPIVNLVPYMGTFTSFSTYGNDPIWSSCPCVKNIPFIFLTLFFKYDISGIIKSTPYISSSGNAIPQSTTIISSSHSKTVIFLPISPSPPRGIIFTFSSLIKTVPFATLLISLYLLFLANLLVILRFINK